MHALSLCSMKSNRFRNTRSSQYGLTLVELMVALAISLVLVLAAVYVFVATRQSDRAVERDGDARETGMFVLQMLGREIAQAGFYPASQPPLIGHVSQTGMIDGYPPYENTPRLATDWMNQAAGWPPVAYLTGIYGCDGAQFDPVTSTCGSASTGAPDTIIINYFTNDSMDSTVGTRRDCLGQDAANHTSNATRKLNTGGNPPLVPHTTLNPALPPQSPLFVSNRYTLTNIKLSVDQGDVNSKSLACSGSGNDGGGYQPIVAGVADLKFSYGVYESDQTYAPAGFHTATEVGALAPVTINGVSLSGWQRVSAVRVCILTQTLGGGTRLGDKAGAERTYIDCAGNEQQQPAGAFMRRYTQVFGVRNALRQTF